MSLTYEPVGTTEKVEAKRRQPEGWQAVNAICVLSTDATDSV